MSPYSRPHIYDIAFDDRDFAGECAFIRRVVEKILGRNMTSALELACGPGRHVRSFSQSGIRSVGLDLDPEMIAYAQTLVNSDSNQTQFVTADMRTFNLQDIGKPVDCCYTLLCGFAHLMTNDDIVRHLHAVAEVLSDGGIYLIATAHPRDFYAPVSDSEHDHSWTNARDGLRVTTTWGGNSERYDPISEIEEIEISYRIEELATNELTEMKTATRLRRCSYQTFRALVDLSGRFEIVAEYGDFAEEIPFSLGEAAGRFLPVLRKRV